VRANARYAASVGECGDWLAPCPADGFRRATGAWAGREIRKQAPHGIATARFLDGEHRYGFMRGANCTCATRKLSAIAIRQH
jgi:hypothetical protein